MDAEVKIAALKLVGRSAETVAEVDRALAAEGALLDDLDHATRYVSERKETVAGIEEIMATLKDGVMDDVTLDTSLKNDTARKAALARGLATNEPYQARKRELDLAQAALRNAQFDEAKVQNQIKSHERKVNLLRTKAMLLSSLTGLASSIGE
jgi:SOS response regulatory protein OraA/RecX